MKASFVLLLIPILLAGCSHYANIQAQRDQSVGIFTQDKFIVFIPTDASVFVRNFGYQIRQSMEKFGFSMVSDGSASDFILTYHTETLALESSYTIPVTKTSYDTGWIGTIPISTTHKETDYISGGITKYTQYIILDLYDSNHLKQTGELLNVWRGIIYSDKNIPDILLAENLLEYLGTSGRIKTKIKNYSEKPFVFPLTTRPNTQNLPIVVLPKVDS